MNSRIASALTVMTFAMFLAAPHSDARHRNVVERVADALPDRATVMIVIETANVAHPDCGRRDDDWIGVQGQLARKLSGQLKDKGNRHKRVDLLSWDERVPDPLREEREEIVASARERDVSHVLYSQSTKYYRFDYNAGWVVDRIAWSFKLIDVRRGRTRVFNGTVGSWNILAPEPLRARC